MWRRTPAVVVVVSVGGAVLAAAILAGPAGSATPPGETITVTQGSPVSSTTVLDPSHRYELRVSGTVSYWCTSSDPNSCSWPAVASHPSVELAGVDALYCYATWRCPTPELWRPLQVNGVGLDQFAGMAGQIPYSGDNTYTVTVTGISGQLSFADVASTPTGSFTVTITDLSGSTTTTTTTSTSTSTTAPPPSPPVIVPTPAGFGTTVTAPEPPPGGTAIITSPALTASGAVSVNVGGISADDLTVLADLKHVCYVNYRKSLLPALLHLGAAKFYGDFIQFYAALSIIQTLTADLERCVQWVDTLEALFSGPTASAAQAGCAFVPATLSISGSGSKARLRSFHVGSSHGKRQALRVSCTRSATGLTLKVASQSVSTPLSSIVGSRLRIGIVRSAKDAPGGRLSVTFHHP